MLKLSLCLHWFLAVATDQRYRRFCPGIQFAYRTGVFCLTCRLLLPDGILLAAAVMIQSCRVFPKEPGNGSSKPAVLSDHMAHVLAGLLPANFSGICRD